MRLKFWRPVVILYVLLGASLWAASLFGHPHPGDTTPLPRDAEYLAEAEDLLERGELEAGFRAYREAMAAESDVVRQLALAGPAARAAVAAGRFHSFVESVRTGEQPGKEWERHAVLAVLYYYAGDLTLARKAAHDAAKDSPFRPLLLTQAVHWAEEAGELAEMVDVLGNLFAERPEEENHEHLVVALIEAGERAGFLAHLEERGEGLGGKPLFWTVFFPDLRERGWLNDLALAVEPFWEDESSWASRFALAELRLFQGKREEAERRFREIFESPEEAAASGGVYFQRLNNAFHNRFAVKRRVGLATDAYGTRHAIQYGFLGLRERPEPRSHGEARDAALLYLRAIEEAPGGLASLRRHVSEIFQREPGIAPGARILAYAILGAPHRLLHEIDAFVKSPETDTAAAEFSLSAINRYVRAVDLFPELRDEKLRLVEALGAKFGDERPLRDRRQSFEMQRRIRQRLAADAPPPLPDEPPEGEEEATHWYFAKIEEAVRGGDPEKGESLMREWQERLGHEASEAVLFYLGQSWLARGGEETRAKAASLFAEYLDGFRRRPNAGGPVTRGVLLWEEAERPRFFPPPNSIISPEELDALQELFSLLRLHEILDTMLEGLVERTGDGPEVNPERNLLMRMAMHFWNGEARLAIRLGEEFLAEADRNHPELRLLLAYLLGGEERYADGMRILDEVDPGAGDSYAESRRLLFAFAARAGHQERVREGGTAVRALATVGGEWLEIARGYLEAGLPAEAEATLRQAGPVFRERALRAGFRRVALKLAQAAGDDERAVGQARAILFEDPPVEWANLLVESRREALSALRDLGGLNDYVDDIARLLEAAPRSFYGHLLRGEATDFQEGGNETADGRQAIVSDFREAAKLRPLDTELYWELCYAFGEREWWREAAEDFQEVLLKDASIGLLDVSQLFHSMQRAGMLETMLGYFADWRMPEARSLDEFYGIQPTAHVFESLARRLKDEDDTAAARRALERGLQLNPVEFTETLRLDYAAVLRLPREGEILFGLIEDYVVRPDPDPDHYAIQPFVTALPRWLQALGAHEGRNSPIEEMLELAEEAGLGDDLLAASGRWAEEHPDWISPALFRVYLLREVDRPEWRTEWVAILDRYIGAEGAIGVICEAARSVFERER